MEAAAPAIIEGRLGQGEAIGLDIGGTKIAAAVVTGDGRVLDPVVVPTASIGPDFLEGILGLIRRLRDRHATVQAIGVGAAGVVEWPSGRIVWAANNPYRDLPLKDLLVAATQLPVVVDNDANTAAWAEARLGLGQACEDMAFVTVGTGVGGALILGGRMYRGATGMATELGHIVVSPGAEMCGCGRRGCLEALASGTALERLGRAVVAAHPESELSRLVGRKPEDLRGRHVLVPRV